MTDTATLGRDFVTIGQAAEILQVTEQTLRNWDRLGKLIARRHPINGYRLYRVADLHKMLRSVDPDLDKSASRTPIDFNHAQLDFEEDLPGNPDPHGVDAELRRLPPCHWSAAVALDPKHRPQDWNRPSSTVRRDWRKYPQEAHVLGPDHQRYRRLTVEEIALLQGFDPEVVTGLNLTDRQRIAGIGDAVPPPLARALFRAVDATWDWQSRAAVEICAGTGGLAEGAAAIGLSHTALIEKSGDCEPLLRNNRPWDAAAVTIDDVRNHDFGQYGRIGLLSGGPPCQPWSASGRRQGSLDDRDLLGHLPDLVHELGPEVFLFENVPGLLSESNAAYIEDLVRRLRNAGSGHRYGVMVGVLNAADFGVPQLRRRVFILGFRDAPSSLAAVAFNRVETMRTHRDPKSPGSQRRPWATVGEILSHREDPGGWRRWIGVTGLPAQ